MVRVGFVSKGWMLGWMLDFGSAGFLDINNTVSAGWKSGIRVRSGR